MKFDVISAGVVSISGKHKEEEKIRRACESFSEYSGVDFCVDESDEDEICIVGTYHKSDTIHDIREMWSCWKKIK